MIILKNGTFIDWQTFKFKRGHVVVDGNSAAKLVSVLPNDVSDATVIDCSGKYITKSFGCAHHHIYSALTTGMPPPAKIPGNYYEILKYIWWTLDKSLDLDMIKLSAYITAIACAKKGVTFVMDHHSSPNAIEGSLQTIADAFNEVGVSHLLCYEISDRDGVENSRKALSETEKYLQTNQGLVGLQASFTLTNKTLEKAVTLAKKYNSGIHVHVAEDIYDQEHCYDIHNKRVVERFKDYGVLDLSKSVLVNCLYLTNAERQIIRESDIHVIQNTESNLHYGIGQFSSCSLGQRILLGTDGMHSDMLRAAKATFFTGQLNDTIYYSDAYDRLRNIHHYSNKNNLAGDGDDNLIVLDYQPDTEFSAENFLSHFIFGIDSNHIQHVISKGKLIVNDRKITSVDEAEIKKNAQEISKKLWSRMHEFSI